MCIINVKVNFLSVFLVRCLELGFKFESLKVRKRVKLAVESTTIPKKERTRENNFHVLFKIMFKICVINQMVGQKRAGERWEYLTHFMSAS